MKSWKQIPIGGVIEDAGNSKDYKTGDWRVQRPIHIPDKCIHCMICWMVCPDSAIKGKDGNFGYFDYNHCKGCGNCAARCPVKAIEMKNELDIKD